MTFHRNAKIVCSEYRAFVKGKPCLICGNPNSDFDHLKARGFGAGKQNDFTGIPLCRFHHVERGQIGDEKFQTRFKINLWEEVAWLLIEFKDR